METDDAAAVGIVELGVDGGELSQKVGINGKMAFLTIIHSINVALAAFAEDDALPLVGASWNSSSRRSPGR